MKDRRKNCEDSTCQYHTLTDSVITDLKDAVAKLLEGQTEMRDTVIQLAEAFKAVDKMADRLEKVEDLQRDRDKEQDKKIEGLRGFMYKAIGGLTTVVAIAGLLIALI